MSHAHTHSLIVGQDKPLDYIEYSMKHDRNNVFKDVHMHVHILGTFISTEAACCWLAQSIFWLDLMKCRGMIFLMERVSCRIWHPIFLSFTLFVVFNICLVVNFDTEKCCISYRKEEAHTCVLFIIIYYYIRALSPAFKACSRTCLRTSYFSSPCTSASNAASINSRNLYRDKSVLSCKGRQIPAPQSTTVVFVGKRLHHQWLKARKSVLVLPFSWHAGSHSMKKHRKVVSVVAAQEWRLGNDGRCAETQPRCHSKQPLSGWFCLIWASSWTALNLTSLTSWRPGWTVALGHAPSWVSILNRRRMSRIVPSGLCAALAGWPPGQRPPGQPMKVSPFLPHHLEKRIRWGGAIRLDWCMGTGGVWRGPLRKLDDRLWSPPAAIDQPKVLVFEGLAVSWWLCLSILIREGFVAVEPEMCAVS